MRWVLLVLVAWCALSVGLVLAWCVTIDVARWVRRAMGRINREAYQVYRRGGL